MHLISLGSIAKMPTGDPLVSAVLQALDSKVKLEIATSFRTDENGVTVDPIALFAALSSMCAQVEKNWKTVKAISDGIEGVVRFFAQI